MLNICISSLRVMSCCQRSRKGVEEGVKELKTMQLLIDKMVLRDCKKRRANLSLAWIDYKKAYDMVPHSWITECLDMMGCAENVRNLL